MKNSNRPITYNKKKINRGISVGEKASNLTRNIKQFCYAQRKKVKE